MYNEILIENLSVKEIEDMINKVSAVAGTVISDSMTGLNLHDAAVSLSKFWRSKSELSPDEMKNNIGYMMVQEMMIRAMTGKTEDIDKQKKRRNEAV